MVSDSRDKEIRSRHAKDMDPIVGILAKLPNAVACVIAMGFHDEGEVRVLISNFEERSKRAITADVADHRALTFLHENMLENILFSVEAGVLDKSIADELEKAAAAIRALPSKPTVLQ